jgi:zinc transport system substrate-binding protein
MNRAASLLAASLLLAACGGTTGSVDGPDSKTTVVVGLYPIQFLAEAMTDGSVEVVSLAAPGVDPHDLELTVQQRALVEDADLVAYYPGFQPGLDDAVSSIDQAKVLDLSKGIRLLESSSESEHAEEEGEDHSEEGGSADPHIWLSPKNMVLMARALQERLSENVDMTAADQLEIDLNALDEEWRIGTTTCASRSLVVSHAAFAYLAAAYKFNQSAVTISPDVEASPSDLKRIVDFVRTNKVNTIYTEPMIDARISETISRATGARVAVLDPIESNTDGKGYIELMRENLQSVRTGQNCT